MPKHSGTQQTAAVVKQEARQLTEQGRLDEARALFASLCGEASQDAEAWFWLGRINGRLGDIEGAEDCNRRAVALQPDYVAAHVNLGRALTMRGCADEAAACYRAALALDPRNAEAYGALGYVLYTLGRLEESAKCLAESLRLDPQSAEAHYNMGTILKSQRRYAAATAAFESAVRLNPRFAAAHNSLGAALYKQEQTTAAVEHYRRAVQIDPNYAEAYGNLGTALRDLGYLEEARRMFDRALLFKPDLIEAYSGLASTFCRQGDAETARETVLRALQKAPRRADIHSDYLFISCYLPSCTLDFMFDAARQWHDRHVAHIAPRPPAAVMTDPGRRLRIGYVSGDFHAHPVGFFISQVLAHHDHSRFEIFAYYNDVARDEQMDHIRACCDHWREVAGLSDEGLAELVREDGIDILVDLAGHSVHNRLAVFARRPAPVQATWMGYFATTGLQAMDYIIADPWVIPPDHENRYTEKVVRLPHSYLCFAPPRYEIAAVPAPVVSRGHITFGCFNNQAKITPEVVECWAHILRALPEARLLMKYRGLESAAAQHHYRELFARHGVAAARLQFLGHSPREPFLRAYHEVDIALDPFPYNGGITTMEALWMGVPVVNLRGDRFVGRVGESVLKAAGLDELVAPSTQAYIAMAVSLASDRDRLVRLRAGLRERVTASPLCDGRAYTAAAEGLYRHMWRARHAGASPADSR